MRIRILEEKTDRPATIHVTWCTVCGALLAEEHELLHHKWHILNAVR